MVIYGATMISQMREKSSNLLFAPIVPILVLLSRIVLPGPLPYHLRGISS